MFILILGINLDLVLISVVNLNVSQGLILINIVREAQGFDWVELIGLQVDEVLILVYCAFKVV